MTTLKTVNPCDSNGNGKAAATSFLHTDTRCEMFVVVRKGGPCVGTAQYAMIKSSLDSDNELRHSLGLDYCYCCWIVGGVTTLCQKLAL